MINITRSLALLAALALLITGCGGSEQNLKPLASNATLLAFGDSLTYGTGAARAQSYPSVLQTMIARTVINAGIPGEISAAGLARLPSLLEQHKPDLVILIHGGNDLLRRQPVSRATDNLRQMIQLSRDSGADVVMLAVPKPGLVLSPAPFYKQVAEELQVPIDEDALADLLQYPSNKSDPVHPNAAGYRIMAEKIAELLGDNGAL